ncbi:hypothetical protein SUT286_18730 [Streptococcus parasuis]|nr:hypothetical protein SUT286_18730 [Streptococcus parasuis]BCP62640.1 hypothetical protein SUT380_18280 [Streptococcus parasuis]GIC32012.1 hypothetical protein SUT328_18410 [Streptococcus parasuis]
MKEDGLSKTKNESASFGFCEKIVKKLTKTLYKIKKLLYYKHVKKLTNICFINGGLKWLNRK